MGVSNDVQLGPGLLYVAPVGTAEPTSASAALATAWREIGYCVDEDTEILTGKGWKKYWELQEEEPEECLTLNPQTGLAEWQTIQAINTFEGNANRDMVRMVGQNHDSLTTPNHRWLVDRHYAPSAKKADSRLFVTTESFGWNDSVLCAAPVANLPTEAKYEDAFVEVVGWWITEGSQSKNQLSIYQSEKVNPQHCASIRAALTNLFGPAVPSMFVEGESTTNYTRGIRSGPAWREYPHRDSAVFYLNKEAGEAILEVAPNKVLDLGFVRSLTKAQLHLLIDTVVAADGWQVAGAGTRFYTQNRKARIDPIQIAGMLAGIRSNLTYRANIGQWVLTFMTRNSFRPKRAEKRGLQFKVERVKHDGMVWCPSTPNKTWLARRNGKVYFTGNTEEGSTFTYELSSEDVFVAEEFDPIRVATTSRTATLAFEMAEVTRRNLALALNVGANEADDGTWFEPPDVGSEVRVMIVHEPEEPASRWIFRQAFQTGSIEIPRRKAPDKALIPVEFKLEKPSASKLFRVYPDADGRI